ncbi:MAG: DUF1254 domain-containing protein [Paracoccaceae bacterium]|nr:DUF1254 domain-containing protein [Paracoccaceae bacterium]
MHGRATTPIDEQVIVRMNIHTFYSSSIHDLAAGPVTVSMPTTKGARFPSLQVISQDHVTPFVIYGNTLELTQQNVVTLIFRTFVDPTDEADVQAAHGAQDAITVEQAQDGTFELPDRG